MLNSDSKHVRRIARMYMAKDLSLHHTNAIFMASTAYDFTKQAEIDVLDEAVERELKL